MSTNKFLMWLKTSTKTTLVSRNAELNYFDSLNETGNFASNRTTYRRPTVMMSTDGPALMTPTISKSEFFLKPAISSSLGAYSSNNRKGSASTITSSAFKGIDSSNLKESPDLPRMKRPSVQENLEDSALYKRRKNKRETRLRFDVPKKSYESRSPDTTSEENSSKSVEINYNQNASINIPASDDIKSLLCRLDPAQLKMLMIKLENREDEYV